MHRLAGNRASAFAISGKSAVNSRGRRENKRTDSPFLMPMARMPSSFTSNSQLFSGGNRLSSRAIIGSTNSFNPPMQQNSTERRLQAAESLPDVDVLLSRNDAV